MKIVAKCFGVKSCPAEYIITAYLAVAVVSIIILRPVGAGTMVLFYSTAAVFIIGLRLLHRPSSVLVRSARILFPLVLFSPLYTGTGLISAALPRWAFSARLERIEAVLFRGQPSMYLAQMFPGPALSETLHAAYVSYYFLVAALPLALVIQRREQEAARVVSAICLCFTICCLCYIWLPVASPFFIYAPFGPPLSNGFFYRLAHGISNRGGVLGGAFPSSHAALTMVNLLLAWRLERRLFWLTLVPSGLLLIATVYCRYHYALDTFAGAALAVVVVVVTRLIWPGTWRDHQVNSGG